MIKHLFKIIWSSKRKNALVMLQLFVSFLALFLFIGLNFEKFTRYFQPLNYNYQNLYSIQFSYDAISDSEAREELNKIREKLQAVPEIELISLTKIVPFFSEGYNVDLKFNKEVIQVKSFEVDETYNQVLNLPLIKGRWFKREDYASTKIPVVITEALANAYGGDAIGKEVEIGLQKAVIVGVSANFKENISAEEKPGFFRPISQETPLPMMLLKSKYANDLIFLDEKIRKATSMTGEENLTMTRSGPLTLLKKYFHKLDFIQLALSMIVFGFLVLNIFLGISGVFSYNIAKRSPEIGLRQAIGADGHFILKQFLGETIILASLAMVPAIFISLQFLITGYFAPGMTWRSGLTGIIGAGVFIYLLMIGCSWYPSLKASKIQPADALHEV